MWVERIEFGVVGYVSFRFVRARVLPSSSFDQSSPSLLLFSFRASSPAQGVRNSTIVNISLRRNKISSLGGVALAIMIKDIPDQPHQTSSNPFSNSNSTSQTLPPSSSSTTTTSTTTNTASSLSAGGAGGNSNGPTPTTTYSAYTPRRRQTQPQPQPQPTSSSSTQPQPQRPESIREGEEAELKPIPEITTNLAGGVTKRTLPAGYSLETPDGSDEEEDEREHASTKVAVGSSLARATMMQSRVRSLDDVTRMGKLVTLDLKGNDLRVSR